MARIIEEALECGCGICRANVLEYISQLELVVDTWTEAHDCWSKVKLDPEDEYSCSFCDGKDMCLAIGSIREGSRGHCSTVVRVRGV